MMQLKAYGFASLLITALCLLTANSRAENKPDGLAEARAFFSGEYTYLMSAEAMSGSIPFSRAGNLIVVKATVDGISGNFILDTGAPGLILNLTYFRHYRTTERNDIDAAGITGQVHAGSATRVNVLSVGPFDYHKVHADRVNLGHLENAKGIKIMGLLGTELFRRFEILIDYTAEMLHLNRAGRNGRFLYRLNGNKVPDAVLPLHIHGGKIIARMGMGTYKLRFILDSGAETNVVDSRLGKGVLAHVEMERKIELVGAGEERTEAWYGRIKTLSAGNVLMHRQDALVTPLTSMSEAYGIITDGMLGFPFLSAHRICINLVNNELYIWK